MRTTVMRSLAVLLVLGAWGGTALGASSPVPSSPAGAPDPVYVDSTEIRYLERFPVQVELVVRGSLPTPCHEPVWEVQDLGDRVDVLLWSLADPGQICTQVLEPFETTIPLGTYESADLPVYLNGEQVGSIQVGSTSPAPAQAPALVGAGWSFGMCAGYCLADLEFLADRVILTGRGHMETDPLFMSEGVLTTEAQERLAALMEELEGVALESTYGCPDCADGGAAYISISRDGELTRHEMEFGDPPAELAELYELTMSIISALETCQSNELVEVSPECQPAEGATS